MSLKKPDSRRISTVPPFGLRMLPDLRKKIEAAAAQNERSMNAEIVARLERTFNAEETHVTGGLGRAELLHKLDQLPPSVQETVLRVVEAILNTRPPSS